MMNAAVSTIILFMSLALAGCARPDTASSATQGELAQPRELSQDQAIDIARQKGREMNVPVDERIAQAKDEGSCFVVEFPPPANARAGIWIFKIEKAPGNVVDTKIWR